MDIFVVITGLVLSFVNVFGLGFFGLYLTMKNRVTSLFNKIQELMYEVHSLKNLDSTPTVDCNICDKQLQIKQLLLDVSRLQRIWFVKLSQAQYRMMADCCEEFLYFEDADKYWERCFSSKFMNEEIESEYHRRFAHYCYKKADFEKGNKEFETALKLPNNTDGRIYINVTTCKEWIDMLLYIRSLALNQLLTYDTDKIDLLIKINYQLAEDITTKIKKYQMRQDVNNILDNIRGKIHYSLTKLSV